MMITCSILISSTKPSVSSTVFSYPHGKIQIYMFNLCLIIIFSSILLRCLSLTDRTWRKCCCRNGEQWPGTQSKPCTVTQVQRSPKHFPTSMKTHAFTKVHRCHIPIQLSICIPAFSGWRQNCGYLIYCSCKRASWSIYKVQGSWINIAVGTFAPFPLVDLTIWTLNIAMWGLLLLLLLY